MSNSPSIKIGLIFLLLLAPSFAEAEIIIPLTISDGTNLSDGTFFGYPQLLMTIDGHPETMLLDTGASLTIVANNADFEKYSVTSTLEIAGFSGKPQQEDNILVHDLKIGNLDLTGARTLARSLDSSLTAVGIDLFKGMKFQLLSKENLTTLVFDPKQDLPFVNNHMEPSANGYILLDAQVVDAQGKALFDTGCEITQVDQELILKHPDKFIRVGTVQTRDATGVVQPLPTYKISELQIGSVKFNNVLVEGLDLTSIRLDNDQSDISMIIGSNIIFQHDWQFDFSAMTWKTSPSIPSQPVLEIGNDPIP